MPRQPAHSFRSTALLTLAITAGFYSAHSAAQQQSANNALLQQLQPYKPAMIATMQTLVNIDSGTDDAASLPAIEKVLAQRLTALGATVEITAVPPSVGKVVVGTFTGKGTKNLMLMIHYDTVFGPNESKKRPFKVEGTRAYGPGVADAKGGIELILHAIEALNAQQFKGYGKLTVMFNADEEKSSIGSRKVIQQLAPQHDYVLSFDPPPKQKK